MRTTDFGPGITPKLVKWFIIIASIVSISSGIIQGILNHLNIFPGPQELLSLSWWGISDGFLWQPLTYALVQDMPVNDITFSFFTSLFINLYIIWVLGSAVNNTVGNRAFVKFMLITIILTGVITLTFLRLIGHYDMLTGLTATAIITLTAWAIRFPNTPIFLFLLIPINSLSLATTIISMFIIYGLYQGEMANVLLYIVAVLVSYLYALLVWEWRSPFTWLAATDNWLLEMRGKFTHNHPKFNGDDVDGATVIDIDTGRPTLQDDAFVEEMLEKIAKKGEESLTWRERERLKKISEKKRNLRGD